MGPFGLGKRHGENAFDIICIPSLPPSLWKLSWAFNDSKFKGASNINHVQDQDPFYLSLRGSVEQRAQCRKGCKRSKQHTPCNGVRIQVAGWERSAGCK